MLHLWPEQFSPEEIMPNFQFCNVDLENQTLPI